MGLASKDSSVYNDKRIFERFYARLPAKIKDSRENFGDRLYLRDASAQGAQLTSLERFYINDTVAVDVQLHGSNPLTLRGSVVWSQKNEQDHWDIGVKFHKIRFVQLSRLVERFTPPDAEMN